MLNSKKSKTENVKSRYLSGKTTILKIEKVIIAVMIALPTLGFAQNESKPTAAVLGIDVKGIIQDAEAMGYMVRLELEKTNVYNIMDKYDVADVVKKNNVDAKACFGKTCIVGAGKMLNADKMITGSVERFGEKIVISLKVIDVKTESVEKVNVTEYLNLQPEIQKMVEISVKKMLGIEPDQNMVNLLINYDQPIASPKTQLKLNGPRMGGSVTFGEAGERLSDSKDVGGFDMYPATFQFGWQQEVQYLSAGNFQGLFEFVGLIGGLESGKFIPSLTVMNGFRFGKGGWEFAFGPSFRVIRKADGFYGDGKFGTDKGKWYLENEWNKFAPINPGFMPEPNPYNIVSRLDSRGNAELSAGLVLAVGRTFKSGYLNIPVNVYVSPRKDGTIVGASFGFNIFKKQRVQ